MASLGLRYESERYACPYWLYSHHKVKLTFWDFFLLQFISILCVCFSSWFRLLVWVQLTASCQWRVYSYGYEIQEATDTIRIASTNSCDIHSSQSWFFHSHSYLKEALMRTFWSKFYNFSLLSCIRVQGFVWICKPGFFFFITPSGWDFFSVGKHQGL